MSRVTVAEVRVPLPSSTELTDAEIQAAIDAATCVVDRIEAGPCGADLSVACLKQVELYLAGHFAAVTENTLSLSSETNPVCGGGAKYGFKFGEGVKGTPFGQMANTLSNGCLVELDKTPARFYTIGTLGDDSILS